MQDRPIEGADIVYRLYRNRRIITVSALLAATGPGLSVLLGGSGTFFADPSVFMGLLGIWTLLMACLAVRFPNAWMDPIALSAALIPFTAATPIYEGLMGMVEGDRQTSGTIWLALLLVLGWFFTYLGAMLVICEVLPRYRLGERRSKARVTSSLAPERLFEALTLQPDMSNILRTTGPVDQDGFFPITIHALMPALDDFEVSEWQAGYRAKIVERDGLRQTTLTVAEGADGTVTTSVHHATCRSLGDGCVYESEEVHDHFDAMAGLGYWLQDFASDYHQADIELLEGRPKRAIRFAPHDSLITAIAKLFPTPETDGEPRL